MYHYDTVACDDTYRGYCTYAHLDLPGCETVKRGYYIRIWIWPGV